jgi:hypothetical protein
MISKMAVTICKPSVCKPVTRNPESDRGDIELISEYVKHAIEVINKRATQFSVTIVLPFIQGMVGARSHRCATQKSSGTSSSSSGGSDPDPDPLPTVTPVVISCLLLCVVLAVLSIIEVAK